MVTGSWICICLPFAVQKDSCNFQAICSEDTCIGVSAPGARKTLCGILEAVLGPVFGKTNNVFILEQVQGKTGRVISKTENLY